MLGYGGLPRIELLSFEVSVCRLSDQGSLVGWNPDLPCEERGAYLEGSDQKEHEEALLQRLYDPLLEGISDVTLVEEEHDGANDPS